MSDDIPVYDAGQWTTWPDPTDPNPDLDWNQARVSSGYTVASTIAPGSRTGLPTVEVWSFSSRTTEKKPGAPQYLIDVHLEEEVNVVGARSFPDLMDLLARWAPVLQAAIATRDPARPGPTGSL
jgi:hypothetical protein